MKDQNMLGNGQQYVSQQDVSMAAQLTARGGLGLGLRRSTHYLLECLRPDGSLRWREEFDNLVVTAGLNDSLDKQFKAAGYTAAWFVGLTDASPTFDAADTMASHGGWTEADEYDEATREALTLGGVAAGSVDNSASKASFAINAGITVGGAFLTTVSTKGGTTGVLYGGGALATGNRAVLAGDTLNVTVTLTAEPA